MEIAFVYRRWEWGRALIRQRGLSEQDGSDNGRVLAITLLVVSLAVADSINPVTIAIAIYLGSTRDPRRRLASYAAGVFAVYLAGGLLLVLGPGALLRAAVEGSHTRASILALC